MKALFLIFALVLALPAQAEKCLTGRSTVMGITGAPSIVEACYIDVINNSGGTLSAGQVVVLDVADDDGASVTKTTTAGSIPICMITKSCSAAALCKDCQTYGYYSSALFAQAGVNAVAGKAVFISELLAGSVGAISSPDGSDVALGVFYDAASATGAVEVFLKMR